MHPVSPKSKKFKVCHSAEKAMLYSGMQESFQLNSWPSPQTILNACCDMLLQLCVDICKEGCGHLFQCVILRHDSATAQRPHWTQELLHSFHWHLLDHPPCGPDFGPLKQHLGSRQLYSDDEE